MKVDYNKTIILLKRVLFELNEEKDNKIIKNKVLSLIYEIEDLIKKQRKEKKRKKNSNINFNSKEPKKSLEIINKLIQAEENQAQKEITINE